MNRDPLGEEGGINLYGFVQNDPVLLVDFYGLEGCGSKGNEKWVPDFPGGYKFKPCCDQHDTCYECGKSQKDCDDKFLDCLRKECSKYKNRPAYRPNNDNEGSSFIKSKQDCMAYAIVYYKTVRGLGKDSFMGEGNNRCFAQ